MKRSYDDRYIGAKRAVFDENLSPKDVDQELINSSPVEFYLIDTLNDTVYGPHTETEYQDKCKFLNIGDLNNWIKTVPRPEGAY